MADVFTAVKPMLFVSKFIGLGPFYIDDEKKLFKVSIAGMVFSTIVLLLFGANSGYTLYEKYLEKSKDGEASYIGNATDVILLAGGIAVTICTILLTLIQRNKFCHVVQNFYEVSSEMAKLDIYIPYHNLLKYSQIQIVVLLIFIAILLIHDVFCLPNRQYYSGYRWVCYFLPNLYNFMMECQFISGALLLKKHFTSLNECLMRFNEAEKVPVEDNKKIDVGINNNTWMENFDSHMEPKIMDQSFTAWDGNFSRFRVRKVAPSDGSATLTQASLAKIKIFRKVHSSLCEIKEYLNSSFSLQLLTSVAQAFVMITANLYMLFTTLSNTEKNGASDLTYPIVWSLSHITELIFIVVTCTKTSKQANQTAVVVHKLLAKDCESDIRNQLKLFSIQLLHRKISFTACGFFTLDMTLLQAVRMCRK